MTPSFPDQDPGRYHAAPEHTLLRASALAQKAGLTRVDTITSLSDLGVEVAVTVRPNAKGDRTTFGKGVTQTQAQIGALSEALEFHFADERYSAAQAFMGTPMQITGMDRDPTRIRDFAPLADRGVDLTGPMALVTAQDLSNGDTADIPAELVFYPAETTGQILFGSGTTGLASGATLAEASTHALLEVIERDIWSFEPLLRTSRLIAPCSLPDCALPILSRITAAGLCLRLRVIHNQFGLPFFAAFLFDRKAPKAATFNGGWACDFNPVAALMRALTEAVQSRVAFLHGDRIARLPSAAAALGDDQQQDLLRHHMDGVSNPEHIADFHTEATRFDPPPATAELQLADLIDRIGKVTDHAPIYRCVLSPADAELVILRLVAPRLENFTHARPRLGPRMTALLNSAEQGAA